jgi:rubrerythrin
LLEVITLAIKEERAGKERYRKYSQEAADPEVRLMFDQLARDEEKHEKQLMEKLQALKLLYLED